MPKTSSSRKLRKTVRKTNVAILVVMLLLCLHRSVCAGKLLELSFPKHEQCSLSYTGKSNSEKLAKCKNETLYMPTVTVAEEKLNKYNYNMLYCGLRGLMRRSLAPCIYTTDGHSFLGQRSATLFVSCRYRRGVCCHKLFATSCHQCGFKPMTSPNI